MSNSKQQVSSGDTVIVACKLPHGLICQLYEQREFNEKTPGGSKKTVQFFLIPGQVYTLNGPAHPQNEGPRCMVRHGFGITSGIPKDFWEKWLKANESLPALKNGL